MVIQPVSRFPSAPLLLSLRLQFPQNGSLDPISFTGLTKCPSIPPLSSRRLLTSMSPSPHILCSLTHLTCSTLFLFQQLERPLPSLSQSLQCLALAVDKSSESRRRLFVFKIASDAADTESDLARKHFNLVRQPYAPDKPSAKQIARGSFP